MTNSDTRQKNSWRDWLFKDNAKGNLTTEVSLELRDAIIAEPRVAKRFFEHALQPLWTNMSAYLSQSTSAELSDQDIMTCVYREIYDEGKWSRLKSYTGSCSLFTWISMIARQAVSKEMKLMRYFNDLETPTVKNSSLTLLSMKDPEEVEIVVSLVENKTWNKLLSSVYVHRLPIPRIREALNMDESSFNKAKDQAETALKKRLLETKEIYFERDNGQIVNLVSLAMSSRTLPVTADQLIYEEAARTYVEEEDYEDLHDLLEQFYPRESFVEQWHHYVVDTCEKIELSKDKRDIFKKRFLQSIPVSTVAAAYDRPNSWVNNLYSRALRELKEALKRQYLIQTA